MGGLFCTDFHIHTNLSDCGDPEAGFDAVIQAAQSAGLEAIGISDHIFHPEHRQRSAVARQALPRQVGGMAIHIGAEVDMQSPSRAAVDAEFAAGLDYVIVAASHLFDPGVERGFIEDPRSMAAYMCDLMEGAIGLGFVDIIAHPLHVPMCELTFADFTRAADEDRLREVAARAAAGGVALECNPRFVRGFPEAAERLFPMLLEEGCALAISSDAHHPRGIGCRGDGYATEAELRALGVSEDHLFRIGQRANRA